MRKNIYDTAPTEVDQLVVEQLVPPDHYLRQVKQVIDCERCRDLVTDGYSADMRRTAEDPVRLIKLEFWPFPYRLCAREVSAEAQVNVALRFFLDLSLESRLPVPSLLPQFRIRLGSERQQGFLDQVVPQTRGSGLVHDRSRLKDATHMVAHIAGPTLLAWVAQTRQRLLDSVRPYWPEQVAVDEAEAARLRQVTADLKDVERLAVRMAHLRASMAWAERLQHDLGPAPAPPERPWQAFAAALALAHRVLADRDALEGGDQVRSVVDPEARRGKHGGSCDGYRLDMSLDADSELLGAVQVLPGNGDEARDAATLLPIDQQLAAMAADQEMQHELRSIEEDFAHAAADGLDTP